MPRGVPAPAPAAIPAAGGAAAGAKLAADTEAQRRAAKGQSAPGVVAGPGGAVPRRVPAPAGAMPLGVPAPASAAIPAAAGAAAAAKLVADKEAQRHAAKGQSAPAQSPGVVADEGRQHEAAVTQASGPGSWASVLKSVRDMGRGNGVGKAMEERAAACGHMAKSRLESLLARQKAECPKILTELDTYGRKVSHWAWWVFPTDLPGASEPSPATSVSPATASELIIRAPSAWRLCLERVCSLIDAAALASGRLSLHAVLPPVDHGRVEFFVKFWRCVDGKPAWLSSVVQSLGAAAGVPSEQHVPATHTAVNQPEPGHVAKRKVAGSPAASGQGGRIGASDGTTASLVGQPREVVPAATPEGGASRPAAAPSLVEGARAGHFQFGGAGGPPGGGDGDDDGGDGTAEGTGGEPPPPSGDGAGGFHRSEDVAAGPDNARDVFSAARARRQAPAIWR